MSKELTPLEALERLKTLEIIKKVGVVLLVPENDYSNEHFDIHIYTKNLTKEEYDLLKEVLL